MRKIKILEILSILTALVFFKNNSVFFTFYTMFIICAYCDHACNRQLWGYRAIRKFLYRNDFKDHLIKKFRKHMPNEVLAPFLLAIEFNEDKFIKLGFLEGVDYVMEEGKQVIKDTLAELLKVNRMSDEEYRIYLQEQEAIEEQNENVADLDRFVPNWREIIEKTKNINKDI